MQVSSLQTATPPRSFLVRTQNTHLAQTNAKVGPSGDPCLGLALGTRLCQRAQTMKNTSRGAFWPRATGVGLLQAGPSRLSPWPHPGLAVGTP